MQEKKIGMIKEELKAAEEAMLPSFIQTYETDERAGVKKLVEQAKRRMEKLAAEHERIKALRKYEKEYEAYGTICGIDEGRARTSGRSGCGRSSYFVEGL